MNDVLIATPAGEYRWHEAWASVPESKAQRYSGRTHGIAILSSSNVCVFHQAVPAMLVYTADGRLLTSWGDYPGAHGLTLVEERGQEYFWLTDQDKAAVVKTTVDGEVVAQLAPPPYASHEQYSPTWVAVNESRHGGNGDVWVADGYGSERVSRYDVDGKYLLTLDGEQGGGRFLCPHGIWFDSRKSPMELYVADRGNHRVQVYDDSGEYRRSFGDEFLTSPDGFARDGDRLIIPELNGRLTILDGDDRLLCHAGANEQVCNDPAWPDQAPLQAGKFNSPHAAALDSRNIYIVEWRVGGRIIKLEKMETHAT